MPNVKVELGLQKAFLLDDPVAGIIGSTTYVLNGQDFVDISDHVVEVNINRGKNRDLDKYVAGSVDVRLRNEARLFDPKYTLSPYINDLVPRRGVRVSIESVPAFTGKATEWRFAYSPSGESVAELRANDAFSILSTQVLTAGTVPAELTGARINRVLDMASVAWPTSDRTIDAGVATVGSAIVNGDENALLYLQQVELSEGGGNLFMSKAGYVNFVDRSVSYLSADAITFADDGTGIPFIAADVNYGSDNLYNQITATSPAGTVVANDTTSQTAYGVSELEVASLLSSTAQLNSLADFLLRRYRNPEYRFQAITVNYDSLTTAQKNEILGMELGDVARVVFTPNGLGSAIDVYNQIIRIDHSISLERHDVTFGLGAIQTGTFVIGDAVFGTIGPDAVGVLAF